jgi:mono/diheme cytochrome c family protein
MAGVYTEAQARRGGVIYVELCATCHEALNNHQGPVFRTSWGGASAAEMLEYLTSSMPKNDPGTLSPMQYVAVMAYLFQLNGMPAGSADLPAELAALRQIRIDTIPARTSGAAGR